MTSNRAVITGATSGIGEAFAHEFGKRGYDLVLNGRRTDRLAALAGICRERYHVRVDIVNCDLSAPGSPERLVEEATAGGPITLLVNNAGFGDSGAFAERPLDKALAIIDLNIRVLTELTHRALPSLLASGKGKILNVASTASFQPGPTMAVYCATKAYVLSFSEAIREELLPKGITVTALCPGATKTEFIEKADADKMRLFKFFPLATAEDVAKLGADAAEHGTAIVVHGVSNKLMAQLNRFLPRVVVRKVGMEVLKGGGH